MCSSVVPFWFMELSEIDLRRDLAQASSRARAVGNAKSGQVEHIRPGRCAADSEVRPVEDVEEFRADLEVDGLRDASALDEPHVVVVGIRVSQISEVDRGAA